MTRVFKVKLKYRPEGVSDHELACFVEDAVSSWGGQRSPEDPLFYSLDVEHIQIGDCKYINE